MSPSTEVFSVSASSPSSTAYLLVFHGSRDPRPAQATERLAQFVRSHLEVTCRGPISAPTQRASGYLPIGSQFERLPSAVVSHRATGLMEPSPRPSPPLVGTACLETGIHALHQQIVDFGHRVYGAGVRTIRIIPLFLLKGIHVSEDIPAEVNQAQRLLPGLSLKLCAHLGSHPGLKALVQSKLQAAAAETWLLLAHGSRRPGGNAAIQTMAQTLAGTVAYWAVPPSLESQVIQLIQTGVQRLAILPYFLFTGSTTDAITQRTEELAERFPAIRFHLLPPLGPSPDLAQLVVDIALNQVPPKPSPSATPLKRVAFRHSVRPSSMVS